MGTKCAAALMVMLLWLIAGCKPDQKGTDPVVHYSAENGFIVGHNLDRYNNRPLYINNTNAFVLTGDKPLVRFAQGETFLGTFMVGIVREGKGKWLQECSDITSMYRSGSMTWTISDASLNGVAVTLEVLPMAKAPGFAVRSTMTGAQKGDRLIWTYGGGEQFHRGDKRDLNWYYDAVCEAGLLKWGFTPDQCRNTTIQTSENGFVLTIVDTAAKPRPATGVIGYSSARSKMGVGDASLWSDMTRFVSSEPQDMPIARGSVELEDGKPVYWTMLEFVGSPDKMNTDRARDPEKAFTEGTARVEDFLHRLNVQTPDSCLNALSVNVAAATDGRWYPPRFVHGPMAWNVPYLGWRSTFGPIMLGWHDRVLTEAKYYIGYQVTKSNKKEAKADPELLLTAQDADSRFNGVGSIQKDQYVHTQEDRPGNIYNMQTQFFDQMIEEWRFTADPELTKILRPALELQLQWEQECFDPDGDGVYESYINSWPTDAQWYNGGGTAEETAYAYRAHTAARDMARLAHDAASVAHHEKMMKKIKEGFFSKLWIKTRGHSGAYREQGGHERLHEDPWLYSIFLPIDAQLTSPLQALESVYYTEWALQNDRMPLGGRMVWASNWWSPSAMGLRYRYSGDNFALALSYFQAGLVDDGWDILKGSYMSSAFGETVPGNVGTLGGTDFADCSDMFARVLVQGLFGYYPDYPDGVVKVFPQFPSDWDHASIETKDAMIGYKRTGNSHRYTIHLVKSAKLDVSIPVATHEVKGVTVDGKPYQGWQVAPGVGCTIVQMQLPDSRSAAIEVECKDVLPRFAPMTLDGNVGDAVEFAPEDAAITGFDDPQGVLENAALSDGTLKARLSRNAGFHTVVAQVRTGLAPQNRVFRIKVDDPQSVARERDRFLRGVQDNASWSTVDISSHFNSDVRAIYQQKYLSPRPNTVSARLGTDGYSNWCFPFWKLKLPEISVDSVKSENGTFLTPQKVPFRWDGGVKNIAFTSLWDNFPEKVTVPVNKRGKAIWFLIAGSTNPMQTQIANAVVRLKYADGAADSLNLVPPVNYWTLCPFNGTDVPWGNNAFCLPKELPETVQLGKNCRAMLLNLKLRKGATLDSVTLETLSQEVVVGLMGVTVME